MVEIKLHNPKLRLVVNLTLAVIFSAFFLFTVVIIARDCIRAHRLEGRVAILKDDVLKKQEALFAAERKSEQTRARMTPREMVEASLQLQDQRQKLSGSQKQLAALEEQSERTSRLRLLHVYWLLFTLIGCPIVFWVNHTLNY